MQAESEYDPISALKGGHLMIHCFRMELVQNSSAQPSRYVGTGYIEQLDHGIVFTMYATEVTNAGPFTLLHWAGAQPGTIFREDESYTLTANSYLGNTWRAQRLINLSVHWHSAVPRISGYIDILEQQGTPHDQSNQLTLHFFGDIDIPCPIMIDTSQEKFFGAKFATPFGSFNIQKGDNELIVDVTSTAAFAPYFEIRVVEALQYVLARSMRWAALNVRDEHSARLQLRCRPQKSATTNLHRPLLAHQIDEFDMFWRLFSKYLEYVTRENTNPYSHKCSDYLYNACEAGANSRDAWTIGLCVAVEKMAGLLSYREPSTEREQREEIQRLLGEWLKKRGWTNTKAGKRASGLLGSMKNARVKDRLDDLVESGYVDQEHIGIWGKLRNRGVHAEEQDVRDITTGDVQKWYDHIGAVTVLMYHLTFHLIGYRESYTDYSKRGWPSAHYPLTRTGELH